MHAVEVTIQNLIGSGMDPKTENNPYLGFTYTSFQERATKISHGNTARHALEHGDEILAKICGSIASDEGRHEIAYQRVSGPSTCVLRVSKSLGSPANLQGRSRG